jgi:predicted extracellular nuclease
MRKHQNLTHRRPVPKTTESVSRSIGLTLSISLFAFFLLAAADTKPNRVKGSTTVFINEIHYDNTGTDTGEAIEVAGPAGTNLSGWSLVLYNGTGGAVYSTLNLSGTIPDQQSGFGTLSFAAVGLQNGSPDGIALVNGMIVVQFLSYEGTFTAVGGAANGMLSVDIGVSEAGSEPVGQSLRLSGTGCVYEDFTWNSPATSSFGSINTGQTGNCSGGDIAPTVTDTTPANNATNIALDANISVTFSEAVNVTGAWFTISGATSGSHTAVVTGGPTTFTLNPDIDFVNNEVVTVTIVASQVTDQDLIDPPDNLASNYVWTFTTVPANICDSTFTPIYTIQGSGASTPLTGQNVTTKGVVTGDFQGASGLNGFYIQDATGDGNTATSDGIFVSSNTAVNAGDTVLVMGTAAEAFNQTVINSVTSVVVCSTGASVSPTLVTLPIANTGDWERYEGMLVTVTDSSIGPLTASEVFTLGRFGEVVVSSGGRLFNPTNYVTPGAAATAEQALNDRRRLLIDDGSNVGNPAVVPYIPTTTDVFRNGYTTQSITGVLGFDFSNYRLHPTTPISWTASNPRPTAPPSVGGATTRIVAMNVLNYFTTIDTGNDVPRGADSAPEFTRQRDKIVAVIVGLDADVIGFMEMENNGGTAVNNLVAAVNAALPNSADHYMAIGDPANGYGTDAIKVTIIYRPAVVTAVGAPLSDNNAIFDRFPVAQTFQQVSDGAKFTVVANHFKSKGCGSASGANLDLGDGQGCWNLKRTQQATALLNFINNTVIPASGDPDVFIIGDLNSYAKEDPITALTNGGYVNLISTFVGAGNAAYSYAFQGQTGYLDHALASQSLVSQITGVAEWHINADEPIARDYNDNIDSFPPGTNGNDDELNQPYLYQPLAYRASDHDPLLIGFSPCALALSTISESFSSRGGQGAFSISGSGACGWTAVSNDSWIVIVQGDSGSGNGKVFYEVRDNFSTTPRTGTISVGVQTFTVAQDGAVPFCDYGMSPILRSFSSGGGAGSVSMTATPGCGWSATANVSWITITSSNGVGNGTMSYTVAPNPGGARIGNITVAGQVHTVKQKGN